MRNKNKVHLQSDEIMDDVEAFTGWPKKTAADK